jgi:hypothetical protein
VFWWSMGGWNEGGLFLGFHSSQTLSCPIIHCTLFNVMHNYVIIGCIQNVPVVVDT